MMPSATMHLEPVFFWLLRATAQVSVVVGLILLLQWTLDRRLGVHGRCCLWLILLVFLVLSSTAYRVDLGARSPWSAANTDIASRIHGPRHVAGASGAGGDVAASEQAYVQRMDEVMVCKNLPWPSARGLNTGAIRLLSLIWLVGAGAFAGAIVLAHLRLRRALAGASDVTERKVLSLLEDCKRLMGVRRDVGVLSTDAIDGPALFGYRRPRLLLPNDLLGAPDARELRHIFLHELAHLKRRDILIGHVVSLLHALQWFNPLVTLAFRRLRADRELACDALALSVLGPDERSAYGHTVVRQLERLQAGRRSPILAALTGNKSRVKRRIALIAGFDPVRNRRPRLEIALALSLACIGLIALFVTGRTLGGTVESAVVTWEVRARRDLPTTCQDRHANIVRTCIRNMVTGKFLTVEGDRVICEADEPGDAGLWEVRFDEASNVAESDVYLYSAAVRKYVTADEEGNLAVDADEPTEAAAWGTVPRPQGVWLISHHHEDGYLRLSDGRVEAESWGRDAFSYWDVHLVWRVKTSDDPRSNPQWYREHVPGPD